MKAEKSEKDCIFYDIPLGKSQKDVADIDKLQPTPQADEQVLEEHEIIMSRNHPMETTKIDTRIQFPFSRNKSIGMVTCLYLVSFLPIRKCLIWRGFIIVLLTGITAVFLYSHALISFPNFQLVIKRRTPFSFPL